MNRPCPLTHSTQPGALPFGDGKIHARVREVPPQLPPDLFLVPLDIAKYAGTQLPDFATMLFTAPTRVYILLPTLTREPKWVRGPCTQGGRRATRNAYRPQSLLLCV